MLFYRDILQGIAEGRVSLAFRRWRRAPPADGSSLRSPVGVLCLDRVTVVDEGDITTEEVRRTGMSPDELRASIAGEGTLLRIELRPAGDDPRIALRARLPNELGCTESLEVGYRLSPRGRAVLECLVSDPR